MDSETDKRNVDLMVESCFRTGLRILKNIPEDVGFVTNNAGETFRVDPTDFYRVAATLFKIAVVYRGNGTDYSFLGFSESELNLRSRDSLEEKVDEQKHPINHINHNFKKFMERCYQTRVLLYGNFTNNGGSITNNAGEIFTIHKTDFYRAVISISTLMVAYRGEGDDYSSIGCSQAYLGINLKDKKEQNFLFQSAIHNLELALKLGSKDAVDYYCLGISQSALADLLTDEREKVSLYQKAIDNLKKAAEIKKNPNIYYQLGDSQRELAPFSPLEKKKKLYKEAISNLTEAVKLRGHDKDYYLLGMTQSDLADCLFEQIEIKELRQQAITHLRKSYELDKNPITLEKIYGIEASIF